MRLTVVGAAPAYTARPGRSSSCYIVEHRDTVIALDFGQGSFSELWRYRSPGSLDAVIISHLHADHCVDLVPLRHWAKYENDGHGPALHGPPELRARFAQFQAVPGLLDALGGDSLAPGTFAVGSLAIEARPVTHIPDSFAFRVTVGPSDGPGVVYSGDCGDADDLVPLVRSGDTLLCEAALGLGDAGGGPHLTAHEAARVARDGGARRLILTHVLDRHDTEAVVRAASDVFSGEVSVADPGLTLDID